RDRTVTGVQTCALPIFAAEPAKDLAAWGLDRPDLRITLTDNEGQPIGTVLGAKHDGKPYVMRAGSETVFEARDYMYVRLDKQPRSEERRVGKGYARGSA